MHPLAKFAGWLALILFILSASIGVLWMMGIGHTDVVTLPTNIPNPQPSKYALTPGWQARFAKVYTLPPGQAVKNVLPPLIPERLLFYYETNPAQARAIPQGPDFMTVLVLPDGTLQSGGYAFTSGRGAGDADSAFEIHQEALDLSGARTWQVRFEDGLGQCKLPGDWVLRKNASPDAILRGLAAAMTDFLKRKVSISHSQIQHDVIVVRGDFKPPPNGPWVTTLNVELLAAKKIEPSGAGSNPDYVLDWISGWSGLWFVDEIKFKQHLWLHAKIVGIESSKSAAQQSQNLLDSLSRQSRLTFTHEQRLVDVWTFQAK